MRRLSAGNPAAFWYLERHLENESSVALPAARVIELSPKEHRVGEAIADLALPTPQGETQRLSEFSGMRAFVFCVRDPADAWARRTAALLADLSQRLGNTPVAFFALDFDGIPSQDGDPWQFAVRVPDGDGRLGRELGVLTSGDCFLLDGARTLVYRGAVDELADLEGSADAPRTLLAHALEAVLAGQRVELAATQGHGTPRSFGERRAEERPTEITWHNRVSRIVQRNCQPCHQEGGVGNLPFESYAQFREKKGQIKPFVRDRIMPPWFAAENTGPWQNDLRLSEGERSDLLAWLATDCPEGSPVDAALPMRWPRALEWSIGAPDYVIEGPSTAIPAEGEIDIVRFTTSVPFPEDRWVQKIQFLPENAGVLHHATVFIRTPETNRKGERRKLFLDAVLVGKAATIYPEGEARFVPKGSLFSFFIHYTPMGLAVNDTLRVGLDLAETPPLREIHSIWMSNTEFVIPAGDPSYQWQYDFELPEAVSLKQFMPHMHLRGKAFRAEAFLPGGGTHLLLDVPHWDPDWQYAYLLETPLSVPAGTRIRCTGTWDNSAANPTNPDATVDVVFGEQIKDEMMGFGIDFLSP